VSSVNKNSSLICSAARCTFNVGWFHNNAPGKEVVKIGEQDQAVPSCLGILSSDPSHCDNDFVRCACVATRNELVRNLVKLRDPKSERT